MTGKQLKQLTIRLAFNGARSYPGDNSRSLTLQLIRPLDRRAHV